MKILIKLFALLLLGTAANAQKTVRGIVTDAATGDPLIGATVLVKNTADGTVTELDGSYELKLENNQNTLVFSFTGYLETSIEVDGRSEVNVMLEPSSTLLDEVVVVGYGVQKKSVVTGSISKVKAEDLEDMPVTRLEQSLQGRTFGVRVTSSSGQPGAGATVRIRGTTTIGDSNPLYVVDGVPIEGGIDYLNQNDVESIEVLKDAASAAIYGARAANGVIIVTTKQGRSGTMEVNYAGYYGTQNPWRKLTLLNATEYATLMNEASVAAGQGILFQDPQSLGEGTDWQQAIFNENAPIQNHELSLSSGNERSTYYTSFGYFDQEGIVGNKDDSRYKRFSVRLNSSHNVTNKLKFGNTFGYTRVVSSGVAENTEFGSPLGRAINLDPITPLYEDAPSVLSQPRYANNFDALVRNKEGRIYGISDIITSEILNPVAALEVAQSKGYADKFVGSVFGEWEILKGLKFRSNIGTDLAFFGGEGFTPVYYLNATNQSLVTNYGRSLGRGLVWNWENTLNYDFTAGAHQVTLLAGTAAKKSTGQFQAGNVTDIPVTRLEDASLLFATDPESQTFYGYEYVNTLASYFGRVNYNFDSKYLLTALLRVDGSSRFGSNNKYGMFPSLSVGWVLTEEDFFPKNNTVNFFKIRGSYGVNGSDRIGDFRYVSTVGGGRSYTFGDTEQLINGVSPNAISNPDLRWEETTQTNIGFDAKIFKGVGVTFDWFNKTTTGMLLGVEVPAYVGNAGPIGNIAKLENKGYELELSYGKSFGGFDVDFSGNISYVQNKILDLGEDKTFLPGLQRFGPQGIELTRTIVGQAYESFYGYKTDGLFQNQADIQNYTNDDGIRLQPNAQPGDIRFVDVNNDGVINEDDRTIIGDPTPDWTYGFNMSFKYMGFDLLLFGQGVLGNDVYNATRRFDLPKANFTDEALGRWTGEGTSTDFPRVTLNDGDPSVSNQNLTRSSDFWIQNGAFFRVKTLQLGYNLPTAVANKAGMKKARIYVSANNLWTLTAYKGFDPEVGAGAGVDKGIYPQPRFFLMGVNVTFGK
ncbi:MAG: TonB-dependent receptor [Saprospiraceae bacterium]|nr:TonB-dependent receptor [Saprospiraceae bacterium]